MPTINKHFKDIKLSAIKDILNLIAQTEGVVSLAWGLPNYSLDDTLKEHLLNEINNNSNINKYPPFRGLGILKDQIVLNIQEKHSLKIKEDNILITVGAMEALHIIFELIINEGDEVILFTPSYASHIGQIQLSGAKVVQLKLDESKGWIIDFSFLEKTISKKTKAILFSNPNNPTGTIYQRETLLKLIEIAKEEDIFLISDETYHFLSYEEKPASLLDFAQNKNLLTVRSFSKEFAMTGFRIGYLVGDTRLVNEMYKAHDATVGFTPTISQYAAYLAMTKLPVETARFYSQDFREKRDLMVRELKKYHDILDFTIPQGAYYILPRYKLSMPSYPLAKDLILKAKVGVVPGSGFGQGGENHLRLSFAGEKKDIVEGVRRLGEYFNNLK
ncbi:pyridoxal phosphate-dependent aminotransferase [Candidatus Gottesmanbacteria bacterium]|nr:pyridoxal phosphate-dependent aminotransferase [Candidatus Gottesmanbacteria bacterium]